MIELVLTLFSGINIAFALVSFLIATRRGYHKLYLYFGIFSLFSGFYFLLTAFSSYTGSNYELPSLVCAAVYYAVFPWFIFEYIGKKPIALLWFLSSIFVLAIALYLVYGNNDIIAAWQIIAHIGLLGLLTSVIYASVKLKLNGDTLFWEFNIVTGLFLTLALDEIGYHYFGFGLFSQYAKGILPLDLYPLLFTILIGRRLSKDRLIINDLKNTELESSRLEKELYYTNKDLTDFGIEIAMKKEFTETIYNKLKTLKKENLTETPILDEVISYTKSQLQIDKETDPLHNNIDRVNHKFVNELKTNYPSLTENELKLASLLRLNLSTKEIAAVKNISPDSVKVLRYRMRKKFNLPTKIGLSQFIQEQG